MARYEYRFDIPVSPETKQEVIDRITELFGSLVTSFPELAPRWFTARSKTKAKPYSPEELERSFERKNVVGLFTSMTESDSCSIILQYMPEINGCFVVSMELPYNTDMHDPMTVKRYCGFYAAALKILSPENSYVRLFGYYKQKKLREPAANE